MDPIVRTSCQHWAVGGLLSAFLVTLTAKARLLDPALIYCALKLMTGLGFELHRNKAEDWLG